MCDAYSQEADMRLFVEAMLLDGWPAQVVHLSNLSGRTTRWVAVGYHKEDVPEVYYEYTIAPRICPYLEQDLKIVTFNDGSEIELFEFRKDKMRKSDFGAALAHMKSGGAVRRTGWNGKSMFIFLVKGSQFVVDREPLMSLLGEGTQVNYHSHIDMRTATGEIVPWVCSQADMLAEDWEFGHLMQPGVVVWD